MLKQFEIIKAHILTGFNSESLLVDSYSTRGVSAITKNL